MRVHQEVAPFQLLNGLIELRMGARAVVNVMRLLCEGIVQSAKLFSKLVDGFIIGGLRRFRNRRDFGGLSRFDWLGTGRGLCELDGLCGFCGFFVDKHEIFGV